MTNIWPRNARFVQCFAKVSSPLWERVMGTRLQAADDLPASPLRKVCQCEEGKTKFMGLEMSRHRTIWLSFQMTETAGKKGAVPDFLTLFMLLNSWIKATGKIQKSSPAHTPPPPPPFIQDVILVISALFSCSMGDFMHHFKHGDPSLKPGKH